MSNSALPTTTSNSFARVMATLKLPYQPSSRDIIIAAKIRMGHSPFALVEQTHGILLVFRYEPLSGSDAAQNRHLELSSLVRLEWSEYARPNGTASSRTAPIDIAEKPRRQVEMFVDIPRRYPRPLHPDPLLARPLWSSIRALAKA
jgi:hypothetical protein